MLSVREVRGSPVRRREFVALICGTAVAWRRTDALRLSIRLPDFLRADEVIE